MYIEVKNFGYSMFSFSSANKQTLSEVAKSEVLDFAESTKQNFSVNSGVPAKIVALPSISTNSIPTGVISEIIENSRSSLEVTENSISEYSPYLTDRSSWL